MHINKKKLDRQWVNYVKDASKKEGRLITERILDINGDIRIVGGYPTRVLLDEHQLLEMMPRELLEKVKRWGKLEGDGEFLGSGSRGVAYKFGNRVLKITNDPQEAQACASIEGKDHPNVYTVHKVGRLNVSTSRPRMYRPFMIVYGFLNYPNKLMVSVCESMYHRIRRTDSGIPGMPWAKKDIYYNWEDAYLEEAREIIREFKQSLSPELLTYTGDASKKYSVKHKKIVQISKKLGWNTRKEMLFTEFWTIFEGGGTNQLSDVEVTKNVAESILKSKYLEYFHQLCLGLTFLYESGVIFNDLKTSNVMEKNNQICIIDIGYSIVRKDSTIQVIENIS
jgi:serine/threonine protein kinase